MSKSASDPHQVETRARDWGLSVGMTNPQAHCDNAHISKNGFMRCTVSGLIHYPTDIECSTTVLFGHGCRLAPDQ